MIMKVAMNASNTVAVDGHCRKLKSRNQGASNANK